MSLATAIANLETRRDNITTELANIAAGVKGYYPTASGQGVNPDHDGHVLRLHAELKSINDLLAEMKTQQQMEGGDLGDTVVQAY